MICRIEIFLGPDVRLSYQMGPAFHGAIMEMLPEELCETLHQPIVHPYSQYIEHRNKGWYWVVTALNADLAKGMIYDALLQCDRIELKNAGTTLNFVSKQLLEVPMEELSKLMYRLDGAGNIDLGFITPVSFKQDGRYLFYPDIRSMYISLLNKYGAAQPDQNVRDDDLLDELVNNTRISRYNLRSVIYHVEEGRVPAFIGSLSLRFNGTKTMRSFAEFLFHFGEYSGIGIKGGLGMGGMRILKADKDRRRPGWIKNS